MVARNKKSNPANDASPYAPQSAASIERLGNVVVAFVGYLGAGCTEIADRLKDHLEGEGYRVFPIKASTLIEDYYSSEKVQPNPGESDGFFKLRRTHKLQDLGDQLRKEFSNSAAVAGLALKKIQTLRPQDSDLTKKIVFIVDSLKHPAEVDAFRSVYGGIFRLVSVFSDREVRESRLIGDRGTKTKFRGVPKEDILKVMERDESDGDRPDGQQVRKTFYLGEFFLNNNSKNSESPEIDTGIHRFVDLITGAGIHRPSPEEYGMYHAFAASLRSSCLSRQVGAVVVNTLGAVVATGMNEVPKFGGGTYDGRPHQPDNRCHVWKYKDGSIEFVGCHKDRKNIQLREQIAKWLSSEFLEGISSFKNLNDDIKSDILKEIEVDSDALKKMPGVKDIIEYSRSIHAEMDALTSCLRSGISTSGATLFCTTYPCHNCARHLVAAGIENIYYIEPYVKSQAIDLHSDAIGETLSQCEVELPDKQKRRTKMLVSAFTGVGPRMFEDHFMKRIELKDETGRYAPPPSGDHPVTAVPIGHIVEIETSGIREILGES